MELYNRFWSKVSVGKEKDCWPWRAYKDRGGYGSFYLDKMPQKAHRVAWELAIGPIPLGMCVLHKCDQRDCCNPAHLFCGTLADNSSDMIAKGRSAKGSNHGGAKLDEMDVKWIKYWLGKGYIQKDIAGAFGVDRTTVGYIKRGKSWKHLEDI